MAADRVECPPKWFPANSLLCETVKCSDVLSIRLGFIESPYGHSQLHFSHRPKKCVNCIDYTFRFVVSFFANATESRIQCHTAHRYLERTFPVNSLERNSSPKYLNPFTYILTPICTVRWGSRPAVRCWSLASHAPCFTKRTAMTAVEMMLENCWYT